MKNFKRTVAFLTLLFFCGIATGQNLRAPAYPLITVDPYFSVWSFGDSLNNQPTVHWTGKQHSMQGIVRVDGKSYYFLGEPIPEVETVLPLTGDKGEWKYTMERPQKNWNERNFKDGNWKTAKGAFSDDNTAPNKWKTKDLWVRRSFEIEDTRFDNLMLNMHQDDNIEVYINGVLAFEKTGWNHSPELFPISAAAKKAVKKGENLLAIHIRNTAGGAYLDAGLVDKKTPKANFLKATQQKINFTATQTIYQFTAGGIKLDVKFTAPLLPDDLDLFSRPANYVTFSAQSADGKSHDVQLYFSVAGDMAVNTIDQDISWRREFTGDLELMRVGTTSQNILKRKGDDVRIDWGYLYLAAPFDKNSSSAIATSVSSVAAFATDGALTIEDDGRKPRPAGDNPITLAKAFDLGSVSSSVEKRHVILAYDQIFAIEYFHQKLEPWWKRKGMTFKEMLDKSAHEYASVLERCNQFDQKLHQETLAAGGVKYSEMCQLVYRQSMAAHKLVEGPKGKPLFFSKENFSNGSIATVDITYPSAPLSLMYNPDLLKGMMIPILHYSQTGLYPHPFAAHDVGTYPVANGMTYGEPMPVEETGNMLVLAAAVARAEGHADFAKEYWDVFTTWSHYLKDNGLDPENQLCTDDFAGHLAHNANLSVKAIMGLASYGYLADKLGMKDTAVAYINLARKYAKEWEKMAADGDHYSLTFDKKGTWSQKYNLIWDKVLQLDIFPKEIAKKELKSYLPRQNKYGLPLDSRKTYTKADWIIWTATLADYNKTFETLSDFVYKYINETPTRVPVSDWYETTNAKQVGFQARSVVGGLFIKALDKKWNK